MKLLTRSLMWCSSALPALGVQTEVSSPHLSNANSSARIDAGSILNSLFQKLQINYHISPPTEQLQCQVIHLGLGSAHKYLSTCRILAPSSWFHQWSSRPSQMELSTWATPRYNTNYVECSPRNSRVMQHKSFIIFHPTVLKMMEQLRTHSFQWWACTCLQPNHL